jgi:hypothetical protein
VKLSRDKQGTKCRAEAFDRFCRDAGKRGVRVGVQIAKLWDPQRQEEEPALRVVCQSTDPSDRDPVRIEELVRGDIRDTVTSLALQLGLRPKEAR